MKIKQIITEANFNPGIKKELLKNGYKFIKGGQDQDAYFAPDGSILKIFGTGQGAAPGGRYSKAQQSFIDFAQYCMANPSNPFLPEFGGVEQFVFDGQTYLQISTERLFDFKGQKAAWLADELEYLVTERLGYDSAKGALSGIKREVEPQNRSAGYHDESDDGLSQLVLYIGGEENLLLLMQTIKDLQKIGEDRRYQLDLHAGNFMLASDGNIVINDPYFTGSWRGEAGSAADHRPPGASANSF